MAAVMPLRPEDPAPEQPKIKVPKIVPPGSLNKSWDEPKSQPQSDPKLEKLADGIFASIQAYVDKRLEQRLEAARERFLAHHHPPHPANVRDIEALQELIAEQATAIAVLTKRLRAAEQRIALLEPRR